MCTFPTSLWRCLEARAHPWACVSIHAFSFSTSLSRSPNGAGHVCVCVCAHVCSVAFSIARQIQGEILSTSGSSTWDNFNFSSESISLAFSLSVLTPFYIFWDQSHRATFLPGHPPVSGSLHVKEQGLGSRPCRDSSGHLRACSLGLL